jgi:hypothetical protein
MMVFLIMMMMVGVTVTYLRSYVTGSNDTILNEVGRSMAVSLVEAHHGSGGASEHSFQRTPRGPAGQRQSRRLDQYDYLGLAAKFP